jgi:hypothetical protein
MDRGLRGEREAPLLAIPVLITIGAVLFLIVQLT